MAASFLQRGVSKSWSGLSPRTVPAGKKNLADPGLVKQKWHEMCQIWLRYCVMAQFE
jgi:hypothetical protein